MQSKPLKNIAILLAAAALLFGCSQKEKPKPAEVRIGQFLLAKAPAEVVFYRKGKAVLTKELDYGSLTGYEKLKPATYRVEVKTDGKLLLEKEIGLGTGGTYTLCLSGMPVDGQEKNQQSTKDILHHIVEGAEGITANAYLPQLLVLNDFFESKKTTAKIRVVHLAPGTIGLSAKVEGADKSELELSGLEYPMQSEVKTISPGPAHLKLKLDGTQQLLATKTFTVEQQHLYTFFVVADTGRYLNRLRLVEGVSTSK